MSSRHTPLSLVLLLIAVTACGLVAVSAGDKKAAPTAPPFKVHPLVFSMIQGLLSDGDSPVVTEVNLDVVDTSTNQFSHDDLKQEGEWTRTPGPDGGFLRYRIMESKGQRYKVEYQENGGGTFTLAAFIEFSVEKRDIRVEGKMKTVRVLRVLSYQTRKP